jgi:HNH endonuclease
MRAGRYPTLAWLYLNADRIGECLIWKGPLHERGYGRVKLSRNPTRWAAAHRHAWRLAGRELPIGYDVHHECGNRACIRVEHLRLMTHSEHTRHHHPRPERCQRGHSDWYLRPDGRRGCRACRRKGVRDHARRSRSRSGVAFVIASSGQKTA